jgi:hypothetical protein
LSADVDKFCDTVSASDEHPTIDKIDNAPNANIPIFFLFFIFINLSNFYSPDLKEIHAGISNAHKGLALFVV